MSKTASAIGPACALRQYTEVTAEIEHVALLANTFNCQIITVGGDDAGLGAAASAMLTRAVPATLASAPG